MKIAFVLLRYLLLAYLAACTFLFFYQRKLLYMPPAEVLGEAPANSIYRNMTVDVPEVGRITNWMVAPSAPDMPTVVFFHGNGSDRTDFMQTGERLHRLGWGVVLASYPGYSGNPGEPSEDSLMASARATLAALGHPPGGMLAWGHSLGSGVAARMASEGIVQGLILEAPYTAIYEVAAQLYPVIPVKLLTRDRFDTRSQVAAIKVPVLIVHADGDPVIPFVMGKELAGLFGTQAQFYPIHMHSHFPHAELDLSGVAADWWQRRIKTVPRFAKMEAAPPDEGAASL
jgi:pimeloyl-ACP methyl ester carboxylesterase